MAIGRGSANDTLNENQVIDASIGKTFDTLEMDETVDGFELYESSKEKVFETNREDFKLLSKPAVVPEKDTRIKKEDAILYWNKFFIDSLSWFAREK